MALNSKMNISVSLTILVALAVAMMAIPLDFGGNGGGGFEEQPLPMNTARSKLTTTTAFPILKWTLSSKSNQVFSLKAPAPAPAPPTFVAGKTVVLAPSLPLLCPPEEHQLALAPDLDYKLNYAFEAETAIERELKCLDEEGEVDVVDIIGDYSGDEETPTMMSFQESIMTPIAQKQLPYHHPPTLKPQPKEKSSNGGENSPPPFYYHPSFITISVCGILIGLYNAVPKFGRWWKACVDCICDPDDLAPVSESEQEVEMVVLCTQSYPSGSQVARATSPAAQAFIGNPRQVSVTDV